MADLIQIRRDRDSVWREVDPVLALAEVGIVQNEDGTMSNPVQFKVGDGTTHWTDLPMQNASAVNKIRVNGSTVLTPTVVGGDRVIDLVIEVSGSVASGNTIAYSDASGHLVDSGISIVNTSGSSSTAVMTQAAVSASVAAVQGNLDSVSGSISSSISESNARIEEVATDLSENYARNDGSYDSMAVGVANNLAGDQEVEGTFISRTAGGDAEIGNGTAQILEVRGKSQVWNQLVQNGNFANTENWGTLCDSFSVLDNVATFSGSVSWHRIQQLISILVGHKYLISCEAKGNTGGISINPSGVVLHFNDSSKFNRYSSVVTATDDDETYSVFVLFCAEGEIQVKNAFAVDLTLMFGAGNEPSTVEEFEAWLYKNIGALEYYPYNAGTVLNNSMEGIETTGFNLLDPATGKAQIIGAYSDLYGNYYGITGTHGTVTFEGIDGSEETITPDAEGKFELTVPGVLTVANPGTDCAVFLWWDGAKTEYKPFEKSTSYLDVKHIYGKANGTGDLVQVFPDGLAGVNGIQDLLHIEDGVTVAERKMRGVNLGSLDWTDRGDSVFSANIQDLRYNGICAKYTILYSGTPSSAGDKTLSIVPYYASQGIYIKDSAYSDVDTFKTAMNGVSFFYKLATPEHYTDLVYQGSAHFADGTPVELPTNYNVDNWGLENILPKNTEEAVLTGPADITCRYSINAVEILNTHTDQIEDLYDSKADKNGTYPGLVAGNLVDADGVGSEQQFMFRPTGGTQAVAEKTQAVLQKYMGKTLAWNQMLNPIASTDVAGGMNVTFSNGKLRLQCTNITFSGGGRMVNINSSPVSFIAGHKYYFAAPWCSAVQAWFFTKTTDSSVYIDISFPEAKSTIFSSELSFDAIVGFNVNIGTYTEDVSSLFHLVDLTLMFGEGHEPSTVAEFEALFPGYYSYNEGTLISNKADSIETVGFNQWDEEWELGSLNVTTGEEEGNDNYIRCKNFIPVFGGKTYYFKIPHVPFYVLKYDINKNYLGWNYPINTAYVIGLDANAAYIKIVWLNTDYGTTYLHDICINISDPAKNDTYEPYEKHSTKIGLGEFKVKDSEGNEITVNGLKSAGSVYDEIDPVKKKYVKRIGEVDLGTLDWTFVSNSFRTQDLAGLAKGFDYRYPGNIICAKYNNVSRDFQIGNTSTPCVCIENNAYIFINDPNYSDAELFKTAMSGVILYYELATPIEYDLVGSIPETYPAFGVGTEAIEPSGVDEETGVPETAPFRAQIFYSKDYLSQLNNMPEDYTSKESLVNMLEALKTAGIIGSYTMTWDSTTGKYTFTITAPTPAS